MCASAVPLLVLLVGPLVFLAFRAGALHSPAIRMALGALAIGVLWLGSPSDGFDLAHLDRLKLALAAAMAAALAFGRSWKQADRRFVFGTLAAMSLLAHYNVLAFHGRGAFIHVHDVAHYYLGSKYAAEISYGELYAAVARAELEIHEGRLPVGHARDLATGAVVPIEQVLARAPASRDRFADDRWEAFRRDVEAIHELMGPRFPEFLNDHGYNPTPLWSLLGGSIARLVPAGSRDGIRALTLADPLLLAAMLAAVATAFGFEVACIVAAHYGVLYGAIFDWTGGAFLRNLWLTATVMAACLLHRARPAFGGVLLALAAGLRVFPVFLILGPAAAGIRTMVRHTEERTDLRFVVAACLSGASLLLVTVITNGGIAAWLDFRANISAHVAGLSSNVVGLPSWLRYVVLGVGLGGETSVERIFEPAGALYNGLVAVFLVGTSLLSMKLALRTVDPVERMALGLFPILFGLRLAHYYSVVLLLLVLAHRSRPDRLAMIFAAESILYVLGLFEVHFSMMCLFRGLVTAYLLIALWFEPMREEARSLWTGRAEQEVRSA